MKCLRNPMTGEVRRVSDKEARHLASYGWTYTTKSVWKAEVRNKYRVGAKPPTPVKRRF